LHIFCGLAQFCKKPCNPVFNLLLFFPKKKTAKNILLSVVANLLGLMFLAAQAQVSNRRPLLHEV
jgi:hypothetical protein